ncbi:hypothetical protein [Lysobacter sp. HA18]
MRDRRPALPFQAFVLATAASLLCTGCHMLGALFDVHPLRIVVLMVVIVALIGFFALKSNRR